MSVALITRVTSRVEHLGVWAHDPGENTYGGRYVPLCGRERSHGAWHITEWPEGRGDGTKRKPLCSRCRTHLDDLIELASRRTPPDTP